MQILDNEVGILDRKIIFDVEQLTECHIQIDFDDVFAHLNYISLQIQTLLFTGYKNIMIQ